MVAQCVHQFQVRLFGDLGQVPIPYKGLSLNLYYFLNNIIIQGLEATLLVFDITKTMWLTIIQTILCN